MLVECVFNFFFTTFILWNDFQVISTFVLIFLGKVPPSIQSRTDKLRYIRGSGEALMVIGDSSIIRAGFKVKIACPFTAIPVGKVSWLKNGKESFLFVLILMLYLQSWT